MSSSEKLRGPGALAMALFVAVLPSLRTAAAKSTAPPPLAPPPAPAAADTSPPVIGFTPCTVFQRDRPFIVTAHFQDASRLFDPVLVYHAVGERTWKRVNFQLDGELWRATIPRHDLVGALQYFVEVFDENGNGPSRVGSPEEPLFARAVKTAPACPSPDVVATGATEAGVVEDHGVSVALEPVSQPTPGRCDGENTPLFCKRWLWYAAGGAVLATIGVIVLASSGGGRGYPDRVTFVVEPAALGGRAP